MNHFQVALLNLNNMKKTLTRTEKNDKIHTQHYRLLIMTLFKIKTFVFIFCFLVYNGDVIAQPKLSQKEIKVTIAGEGEWTGLDWEAVTLLEREFDEDYNPIGDFTEVDVNSEGSHIALKIRFDWTGFKVGFWEGKFKIGSTNNKPMYHYSSGVWKLEKNDILMEHFMPTLRLVEVGEDFIVLQGEGGGVESSRDAFQYQIKYRRTGERVKEIYTNK